MARDDRFKGAFYQGRERPSLMNRIGGALMGFGEGYAGRGQQFIAARRAEQEKEQNDLMRASISDAKQVLRQLGNIPPADGMQEAAYGNLERMTGVDPASAPTGFGQLMGGANQAYNQAGIKESVDILNDRVGLLKERGQDTSETMWLRDKLLTGDIDAAKSEIAGFLAQAKDEGFDVDTQEYMKNVVTLPNGQMGQILADGTVNYVGPKPLVGYEEAGSAEGKIYQDYQRGVFGIVGTQEAMAARDAAIAQEQRVAPITETDSFGNPLVFNEETRTFERATPTAQSRPETQPRPTETMEFGADGRPIDTIPSGSIPPEASRPVDPTEYVPYDVAIGSMPGRYDGEPDHVYEARAREDLQNRQTYRQQESARVRTAEAELSVENRAFAKTKNLARTIVRLRNNQSGLTAVVGEFGKTGRVFTGIGDFIAGAAGFDQQKDRANALADIESLQSMMLTEELDLMTGPLTDRDLEVLLASATTLGNTKQEHSAYNRELNRVLDTLQSGID